MTLHELKIWVDGFSSALKDQAPNKDQWKAVLDKIAAAHDASTKGKSEITTLPLKAAKK